MRRKQWIKRVCGHCQNSYEIEPYRLKRNKYCSRKCHNTAISRILAPKTIKFRSLAGKKNKGKKHPKFAEYLRNHVRYGSNNPAWKGGVTSKHSLERRRINKNGWSSKIFIRDDHTCQLCGKRGGDLEAHHIKKFRDYPHLRDAVSNGVTLCKSCHNKTKGKEKMFEKQFIILLSSKVETGM